MNKLRTIANIAILSPILLIVAIALFLLHALLFSKGMNEEQMWGASFAFAIPFAFLLIGVSVLFLAGVVLHGVIAAKTKKKTTWAWWTILIFSVFWVIQNQWSIRITGIGIMVLLLIPGPYKILRRGVEQPDGGYQS